MEWVLKLEAKRGWGEVETIEVGRLERRVSGLTAEELGLTLAESKRLLGELARLGACPDSVWRAAGFGVGVGGSALRWPLRA
jgi:hypothetical protein